MAEEVYVQEMSSPRRKRTLKSDFLFVKYPDVGGSMVLRDVFEVDGKPVRDAASADRMMKLFTSPVPNAVPARARAGPGGRALQPAGHRHLEQSVARDGVPAAQLPAALPLQPRRHRKGSRTDDPHRPVRGIPLPTILQDRRQPGHAVARADLGGRADRPRGEDAAPGRAVRGSRRRSSPPSATTTDLGIDVPAEMRDWYPDRQGEIRGVATYGRFRRFQVRTDEVIQK